MTPITIMFILMTAPSPTDDAIENYAVPLGIYGSASECMDSVGWINEHSYNLPRHLWCMPVSLVEGERL